MFVGLIVYSDTEFWNTGYSPIEMHLPSEFIALNLIGIETGLNKTITLSDDIPYDFKDELNITGNQYGIRWGYMWDAAELWSMKKFFGMIYYPQFIDYFEKEDLINAWDADNNASIIKVELTFKYITLIFEDTNRTRNNIEDAYDDGIMFCTMIIPDRTNLDDGHFSARDIVFALLTFRLPSVLVDIHPFLAHMISIVIYTQLSYLFFMIITTFLHGGA